jgi:hypothetical protein
LIKFWISVYFSLNDVFECVPHAHSHPNVKWCSYCQQL